MSYIFFRYLLARSPLFVIYIFFNLFLLIKCDTIITNFIQIQIKIINFFLFVTQFQKLIVLKLLY